MLYFDLSKHSINILYSKQNNVNKGKSDNQIQK